MLGLVATSINSFHLGRATSKSNTIFTVPALAKQIVRLPPQQDVFRTLCFSVNHVARLRQTGETSREAASSFSQSCSLLPGFSDRLIRKCDRIALHNALIE